MKTVYFPPVFHRATEYAREHYTEPYKLEMAIKFLQPILDQCGLTLINDAKQSPDVVVVTTSNGSGRWEWQPVLDKLFVASQGSPKLTLLLVMRKNNEHNNATPREDLVGDITGGPDVASWLRRVRNAHIRTVDYHYDAGLWPTSVSYPNKQSHDWIVATIKKMQGPEPWQKQTPTSNLDRLIQDVLTRVQKWSALEVYIRAHPKECR